MASRTTLAVSLALIILLAGCSGLIGGEGSNGSEEVPDDPEEFDYAAGFAADGITDGAAALGSYDSAVQATGSYSADYGYVVETDDGDTEVDAEYRVDFEAEQARQEVTFASPDTNASTHIYYEDDRRYSLGEFEGERGDVAVEDEAFPPEELTASEAIEPLLLNATDYDAAVDERNGQSVVVYETSDIDGAGGVLGVDDPDNVSSFDATFTVDSDGLIHVANYELVYLVDGEERTVTMEFELSAFGETTVERPDWADDADES